MAPVTLLLAVLFALDQLFKLIAVFRFFRRPTPVIPLDWPAITLIQPITRGASGLSENLRARSQMEYPGRVQHLFICDAQDSGAQAVCARILEEFPGMLGEVVQVAIEETEVAPKIVKLQAGHAKATSEILAFIDDDVAPRPNALQQLIPYLLQPGVGAVFGLPCYTNWRNIWSSLMSGFVNANMLMSFVALTFLTEPFRITGHFAAVHRVDFENSGGLKDLEGYIDDDYAMAQRLRAYGKRLVQTPLIYDINNDITSAHEYAAQLKRWFVMPRQAMAPTLSLRQNLAALAVSGVSLLLPALVALLTLLSPTSISLYALAAVLAIFYIGYDIYTTRYLRSRTPLRRWPLLILVALVTPVHAVLTLLSGNEIEWRGKRIRVHRGGSYEVLS